MSETSCLTTVDESQYKYVKQYMYEGVVVEAI